MITACFGLLLALVFESHDLKFYLIIYHFLQSLIFRDNKSSERFEIIREALPKGSKWGRTYNCRHPEVLVLQ